MTMARMIIPDGRIQPPTVTPNGNPIDAGIWQIDGHGRKYRKIGNGAIEYMPTITIDGVEIENTPEALEQFYAMNEQARQQEREAEAQKRAAETGKICPLHGNSPMAHDCKRTCALFCGDSCALAARPASIDTKGKPCPLRGVCGDSCALYRSGCTLTNMIFM